MNLRVRRVTGLSLSAMVAVWMVPRGGDEEELSGVVDGIGGLCREVLAGPGERKFRVACRLNWVQP